MCSLVGTHLITLAFFCSAVFFSIDTLIRLYPAGPETALSLL